MHAARAGGYSAGCWWTAGTRKTRRVANRWPFTDVYWNMALKEASDRLGGWVPEVVPIHHPSDGYEMLVLSDVSDAFWGGCMTQDPDTDFESGAPVADMHLTIPSFNFRVLDVPVAQDRGKAQSATSL